MTMASFAAWSISSNEIEKKQKNPLMMVSIEALSRSEGTGNTGPKEEKKCRGGYHKGICMCVNNHDCTETDCY